MRIVHLITRLILGGAQENTLLSCEDLIRDYGDEVLLVTGPPRGPEGSLLERCRAGGVPLEIVESLRRPIHPLRDTASFFRIRRILQDFQPDVVHTHSAKGGILGRAAAKSLDVPAVIHTVHGAPFHPYQSRTARAFFRWCERWAARRCHALISVADAMTDLMVDAGIAPRDRFTTIYSGMEVEPFLESGLHRDRVRRELGYSPDHVVVGKVARLFHLKGHEDMIEAASRVVDVDPNVRFLLVGDGLFRQRLEDRIAVVGLTDYFQFTGLVPPDRVAELLAATDLVVHASLREGLARVLPQALIAGKPVVSYDINGACEVVIPGKTGYLIPPREVVELAESILRLVADPALRKRLGEEGRRRFADIFRHERMTAQIRGVYDRVLGSRDEAEG